MVLSVSFGKRAILGFVSSAKFFRKRPTLVHLWHIFALLLKAENQCRRFLYTWRDPQKLKPCELHMGRGESQKRLDVFGGGYKRICYQVSRVNFQFHKSRKLCPVYFRILNIALNVAKEKWFLLNQMVSHSMSQNKFCQL